MTSNALCLSNGFIMQEKYLVTPALPYANGPIHLGHLVEHIQVNIFVRALRMAGQDVLYVCGADSHGTPIEINAKESNKSPEDFAREWQKKQEQTFKNFLIEFDGGFGSTHTKSNEEHAHIIFAALKDAGVINQKEIEQLFDPELKRFLPDRLVRGTCPKCQAPDQYGDSCEACGRTYTPTELINPKSALSGATPILKKSMHYFVALSEFEDQLKTYTSDTNIIQEDTRAYLKHWFQEGLKDWDISRDGPYFGFRIPGETDKYFYVWMDAPIGYISLSDQAAKLQNKTFADYWLDPKTKIIHFIGKDIVYFHTLFWPAMLMAARYTLPSQIVVHGMLTVDGVKMSKSRGTFIMADIFKEHINAEALRYYYACKLSRRAEDLDLSFSDFTQRVNTDLVNKIVNILSRALPLLHRFFGGTASMLDNHAQELINKAKKTVEIVKDYYLTHESGLAMNEICRLAEDANKYLQDQAPWKLAETDPARAQAVLSTGVYLGKVCFALLKPVLPEAVNKLEVILNAGEAYSFATIADEFKPGQVFRPYDYLFQRIEEKNIKALQEASCNSSTKTDYIDIQQFMNVDLRAGKILKAESVKDSDKLISCTVDMGELGTRHIFSGLRPHVEPESLVGKTVVVVANLAPRTMRFGVSEGMILAAVDNNKPYVVTVEGVAPGSQVR
jgi:methionyl-tRNA synthetase